MTELMEDLFEHWHDFPLWKKVTGIALYVVLSVLGAFLLFSVLLFVCSLPE